MYKAFKKYNLINFEFNVIEHISDSSKLDEREQHWMDFYKVYDKNYGYNLRPKAESNRGYKLSEESRKRFSDRQKRLWQNPDYTKNMSEKGKEIWKNKDYKKHMSDVHKGKSSVMLGKKHTEETKLKMAESHKGKKFSEKHKLNISLGNTGRKCTEETKRKIGLANSKKSPSKEVREKISLSLSLRGNIPWNKGLKGYKISDKGKIVFTETKIKLAEKSVNI